MSTSDVCRMCLIRNTRMHRIDNIYLLDMYEKLTNIKLSPEDMLPKTICYVCYSQLQRFRRLSDMAYQSEKVLRDHYIGNGNVPLITPNFQPALNLAMVKNLSVTVAQSIFKEDENQLIPTETDYVNNYICLYEETPVMVKIERFKEKRISEDEDIVKTENHSLIDLDDGVQNDDSLVNDSNETNSSNESDFCCDICKQKFETKGQLQTHLRSHNVKKKTFTCKKCNKSFSMVHNLRKHLKNCTGEKKTFTCEICGKVFYNCTYFKQHMNIHIGARPFACKVCGKTFSKSSTLYSHKRCHTGEKPYLCNTCGMTFGFKCSLNLHIRRVHTEVKPYACNICSLSFNYESGLTGHMQTHSAVRPYVCDVCRKGFTSTRNLKAHMTVHSGERPHNCNRCGKAFKRLEDLRKHMKTTRCQATNAVGFDLSSIMSMGTSSTMSNHH